MGGHPHPHDNPTADSRSWQRLPNLITCLRIMGSPALIVLAWLGQPFWLGVLTFLLVLTEWLDGFLARRLAAESPLGARLDTVADALFYSSLLLAVAAMRPNVMAREAAWIAAAIASYLCSWLASWIKFRRLPSYHTWAAKAAWVVVGLGIVNLLAGWAAWPFRVAMLCVVIANLEAVAITTVISESRVDVPFFWHARR